MGRVEGNEKGHQGLCPLTLTGVWSSGDKAAQRALHMGRERPSLCSSWHEEASTCISVRMVAPEHKANDYKVNGAPRDVQACRQS